METNAKLPFEVTKDEVRRFVKDLVEHFMEDFTPKKRERLQEMQSPTNRFHYEYLLADTGPNGRPMIMKFFIALEDESPNAKIKVWLGEEVEGYWRIYEFVDGVSFTLERERGFEVCRLVEVNRYGGAWCVWWKDRFSSDAGIKNMLQEIITLK